MNTWRKKQEEIDKVHQRQVQQLEVISGISAEEAKDQLVESLKESAKQKPWRLFKIRLRKLK